MKTRPSWVVLVPKRKTYPKLDDRLAVVRGNKRHDAIVEYEPGSESSGEDQIAKSASRGAKQPAYVLWCNEDYPRVQVFAKGRYAGELEVWPDSVARQLGCTFPTIRAGRATVDLTPHKTPSAKKGDPKIGQWTVRQWKHMIEHTSDWSILLDGAGADYARHVVPFLDDVKPDTRVVACEVLGAIGYIGESEFGLGTLAPKVLERFRELAVNDPDARVRAAATKRRDRLAESIEMYTVRAEFPWLTDHSARSLDKAFAALDDKRDAVRSHVVSWWMFAWEVPKSIGKKAETKLVTLLARATTDERSGIELALDHVRQKMAER